MTHDTNIDPYLPEKRTFIGPAEGWEAHAVYLVAVAYNKNNPVHRALLHVGFLKDSPSGKVPGNYSEIWLHSYDSPIVVGGAYYLRVIRKLCSAEDMGMKT